MTALGNPNVASGAAVRDEAVRWMNRGFALGASGAGDEAIAAYAQAIALLRSPSLRDQPPAANSLGAALMNHGHLLHCGYGLARADAAMQSFDEAIEVLTAIPNDVVPWARRNLAGTYVNRANLQLDLAAESRAVLQPALRSSPARAEAPRYLERALADACAALPLVAAVAHADLVSAGLALQARRAACDALGQLLVSVAATQQDTLATEAAELVDDALALIRFWTGRDEMAFAGLAVRFFRFGAELYRRHQPHFLAEFIEENLSAAPTQAGELRVIAQLAVDAALADGAAPAHYALGDAASERALRTRHELITLRAHLAELALVA